MVSTSVAPHLQTQSSTKVAAGSSLLELGKKLLSFTVPIRPLDELFPESDIGFIKIDVEGYEMADYGEDMEDPMCRILMRSAGMEGTPGMHTTTATGMRCECDEEEKKVISKQAVTETRKSGCGLRWRCT